MPDNNSTPFSLINPVTTGFSITDPFNSPRAYANGRHEGVDLRAVVAGRPAEIVAAQRGTIDRIRMGNSGYGNYVRIRHDWADGTTWVTWYAHLSSINPALQVGDVIETGQRLGIAGTTGNSTGVHLHLTLQHLDHGLKGYVVDDVVDPTRFFSDVTVPVIDELGYVADVTLPDGSTVEAGQPLTKTWRVRNAGTSNWTSYTLEHFSDDRMGGPDSVPLPALEPDEVGEVSVSLVAPATPGRRRSTWKARNSRGRLFAFELFADIVVSPVAGRHDAVFVADVTLPDGEEVQANRKLLKTWRVRNTGDTTWDKTCSLVNTSIPLGASGRVALPTAKPGTTADLSVALTTPDKPGIYRSVWRLQSPDGRPFGPELFAELRVISLPGQPRDNAEQIADVTIPAGTRLAAGAKFTKVWKVRNTGPSPWGEGHRLAFLGDNTMGGPATLPLPNAAPGHTANLTLELIAPTATGRHRSSWQCISPTNEYFGDIFTAEIEVEPIGAVDKAVFVSDVTIPDGDVVAAGTTISKTWRIRNGGSSSWSAGYTLAFAGDEQMNGPDSVPLPVALPGELVEVGVSLQAPLAPGIHRSLWRARNPEGQLFGDLLDVEIRVPVSSTPGSTSLEDAQLEAHVTYPDGTEVRTGTTFEKTWAIRNTGSMPWTAGYALARVGGAVMDAGDQVTVASAAPQGVAPQGILHASIKMTAPPEPGRYISRWRMRNSRGEYFGSTFFASIVAVERPTKFDLLPYLRGDGRLYEMKYIFEAPNGPLIGQQRVQTQHEDARFYQTKNSEWEEMWADDRFIYRGTDTSPGSGNFYTLMDGERYGTAWVPRFMAVDQTYRRSVVVVSRRKGNCVMNSHLSGRHITWVRLEAIHNRLTLPDVEGRPGRGHQVDDVVVLAAYNEVRGRPAEKPFERYYYAKGFGLVMWEGIDTDHRGYSFLVQVHKPGDRPDNVRERIPCLESLRP